MATLRVARAVVLSTLIQSMVVGGDVWNAAADFSPSANPNGAWSYGWSTDPGVAFSPYTATGMWAACLPEVVDQWFVPIAADPAPHVSHNPGAAASCPDVMLRADELVFHPGPGNEHSVIRWTAPSGGKYLIEARFEGRDVDGASTDVHLFHNGIEVFNGYVAGTGESQAFSQTISAGAGDHLDFTVGFGGNSYFNDTTAAAITIVRVFWDAAAGFSATANPNGPWRYGWSDNPGVEFSPYTSSATWAACLPDVVNQWFEAIAADPAPHVSHNPDNAAVSCSEITMGPGELVFHPGPGGQHSVVRWEAPVGGVYMVNAQFEGRDVHGASTDVHVFRAGLELFNSFVTGINVPQVFSQTIPLAAGDHLDFTVGFGGNSYENDTTSISLTIERTTSIPTLSGTALAVLAGSLVTAGGVLLRRARKGATMISTVPR